MKRIALTALGFAAALPLSLGLAGCAGMSDVPTARNYEVDTARVAAIESVARRVGVGVIWINQPMKKQPAMTTGG